MQTETEPSVWRKKQIRVRSRVDLGLGVINSDASYALGRETGGRVDALQ